MAHLGNHGPATAHVSRYLPVHAQATGDEQPDNLIVDDDPSILATISEILEFEGYSVRAAPTVEALGYWSSFSRRWCPGHAYADPRWWGCAVRARPGHAYRGDDGSAGCQAVGERSARRVRVKPFELVELVERLAPLPDPDPTIRRRVRALSCLYAGRLEV
jgi:CheY-like chemotaxis protein